MHCALIHAHSKQTRNSQFTFIIKFSQSKSGLQYLYPSPHHCEEGDGPGGMVVDGNEVDDEGRSTDQTREQRSSTKHLLNPVLPCSERVGGCV